MFPFLVIAGFVSSAVVVVFIAVVSVVVSVVVVVVSVAVGCRGKSSFIGVINGGVFGFGVGVGVGGNSDETCLASLWHR